MRSRNTTSIDIFVGPYNIFSNTPNLGLAAEPALAVVPPHLRHAAALGLGELGVASPVPSAVSDMDMASVECGVRPR